MWTHKSAEKEGHHMETYHISDYGVRPDTPEFQTAQIQAVLDLCKNGGGKVIFPAGTYRIASLRLWSDTTIYLEAGAQLFGSTNCNDYTVFDLGKDFEYFTDSEAFAHNRGYRRPDTYRRAMLSAFGERNITITGEPGSLIDGMRCYDAKGEENFRGPHGIFMSSCKNITLTGYTIQHTGNFMHQLDNCENVRLDHVTALAGHDGIHLHCCKNMQIQNCTFITGDDCIAGANVEDVTVSGCTLNTSCNTFRIGGANILIENCTAEGPGYYPHLLSVVKGPEFDFQRTDGRHNTVCFLNFFSSKYFQNARPADITVRNCRITNVDQLLSYDVREPLHNVGNLKQVVLENVTATGLKAPSSARAYQDAPVSITLKNVTMAFSPGAEAPPFDAEFAVISD